jgi:hypothetical protein
MSGGLLHQPGPLTGSGDAAYWIFTSATALMVIASVAIAIREAARLRSSLPLIVFASATLWLPNEPFIDAVLGFQYAGDSPADLWTVAGRPIPPMALGIGAMFFIFTWIVYRMILEGTQRRTLIMVAVVAGVIDWPLEMFAIHNHVFEYYASNLTVLGLPLTSMVQNCFLYLLMASVLVLCAPHIRGWRGLLFLPVIPGCYYAAAFVCTWPLYLGQLYSAPHSVLYPLAVISVVLNAAVPLALLNIVAPRRGAVTDRVLQPA